MNTLDAQITVSLSLSVAFIGIAASLNVNSNLIVAVVRYSGPNAHWNEANQTEFIVMGLLFWLLNGPQRDGDDAKCERLGFETGGDK